MALHIMLTQLKQADGTPDNEPGQHDDQYVFNPLPRGAQLAQQRMAAAVAPDEQQRRRAHHHQPEDQVPANDLFRQVDIGGHHRSDNSVANHHIEERHVVTGGGGKQDNQRRQNAPDAATKQ